MLARQLPVVTGSVGAPGGGGTRIAARERTICGHQNHLPMAAAIAGVMKDRTTRVSNRSPSAMVVPTWPITFRSLNANVAMVAAKTSPADVTTEPVPAIDRMIP